MMREEEEEETLFDQEGLLGSGRKSTWDLEWVKRFTKTLALSLAFFALGLCVSIPGATLLDLEERTHTTTEHISFIFTGRSLGYLLGSVVGGVLFVYFDQQILLFYTLVLTGMATIAVPWCTALVALASMIAVQGLALGVLDTGGNMFCIKIWNKSSAPYLQALHFSFAVGAFLAPLLARPFLVGQGALGPNSTVFSASHYPVNVQPIVPAFSDPGGSQNNDRHARSAEALWWTERWNDRVVREVGNETGDGVTQSPEVAGSGMNTTTSGLNSTDAVSALETTTVPRQSKPSASDGKHLNKEYANGVKAKETLTEHKQVPARLA
ncbi:sodium-dependent glucose transporter 1-like isoform X2 [Littorina saxatilis]|uniref:Sodium-dependent glucose transporter 1 n=1 Tax=Littorina saxatilis TaxID=31220 RepID=A0AAN9G8W9_9CAEN